MSVTEITSEIGRFPDMREVWQHRRLGVVLAYRNIKVRYMQTTLGSVWLLVQPILQTGIMTVLFGLILAVPSEAVPYPLFAFAGMTFWNGFNRTVTDTGVSLAGSGSILQKVYFPRLLIPISTMLTALFDLVPICGLVILATVALGLFPGWPILLMPVFAIVGLLMAVAIGLLITVLDAAFRDIRLLVGPAMQFVFFATPIVYAESVVPERWKLLYHLNPVIGLVQGFRWSAIAGLAPPSAYDLAWSCGFTAIILTLGLMLFARLEGFAVDRI